jgi:hypothetical protein
MITFPGAYTINNDKEEKGMFEVMSQINGK